jgi:hypothetical protein
MTAAERLAELEAFIEVLGVSELTDEEWDEYRTLKGWK